MVGGFNKMEGMRSSGRKRPGLVLNLCMVLLLAGCVEDYPEEPLLGLTAAGLLVEYSLTVTVEGLQDPGLVLVNGSSTLTLDSSGSYTFPDRIQEGSNYNVIIQSQPAGYECLVSNGSGVMTGDVSDVRVECLHAATITPADRTLLQPGQTIRIVFNRSMSGCTVDTTSTPLPANLGTEVGSAVLATTSVPNDTLEISPTTTWSSGSLKFLYLNNCQSSDGSLSLAINLNYVVASNAAYVAPSGTDAGDCSTVAGACATINYAINELVTTFGCNGGIDCAVLVAEGTYDMAGNTVTMADRVSLLGSFRSDFTARFPSNRSSILSGAGGACGIGNCHIRVPGTVTANTLIEGFTIEGDQSGATDSSGVQINGSIRVADNTIRAGDGTAQRVALNLNAAGPDLSVITGNRIETGNNAVLGARAVVLNGGGVDLYRNQILTGGAGNTAEAIVLNGGSGSIHTNGIYTGISSSTTGISVNFGGNYDIVHNLIIADEATGGTATGLQFQLGPSSGAVINNMILGNSSSAQSYCIRDVLGISGLVDLDSNNLIGCPTALMEDSLGTDYTTICNGGSPASKGNFGDATCTLTYTGGGTVDNYSTNPMFVNPNPGAGDFRYSASSPCLIAQGGVDPTTYGTIVIRPDADFQPRPGPDGFHSVGPFEPQMGCLP